MIVFRGICWSLLVLSLPVVTYAQSVSISTDRNQLLIGERVEYVLTVKVPSQQYSVNFNFPDSLPHFDIIAKNDFDTNSSGNAITLSQKVLLTSFDSGAWYIPAMRVQLQANGAARDFTTDSVLINVNYSPSDTANAIRDIKPIIDVEKDGSDWLYIIAGILSLLLISWLISRYLRKRKEKPKPILHSSLSPYEEAMRDIGTLEKSPMSSESEIKQHHARIDEIFKRYYSRTIEENLLNKTTGELLLLMKTRGEDSGLIGSVAAVLRQVDAVKFAKYVPAGNEFHESLQSLKNSIGQLEKNKKQNNPGSP